MSHIPKFGDASKSPVGYTASPAGDGVVSPNCGICDSADFLTLQVSYGSGMMLTLVNKLGSSRHPPAHLDANASNSVELLASLMIHSDA